MIAGWVLSGSWPSAWVTHPSREPHLSSVRFSHSFRFFSLRNSFGDSLFSQNIKSPVLLCWEFGSIFLLLEGFFPASTFRLTRPHPKSWPESCTRQETGYCWFPYSSIVFCFGDTHSLCYSHVTLNADYTDFYVFWNWRKYLIKPVNFYTDNKNVSTDINVNKTK